MKKRDTGATWVLLDSHFFFERESVGFSGSELTEVRLCPKNIRFPTKTLGLLATDPS
jgi:hypothetical protein